MPSCINILLCDDARTEGNGKQIIIGVYAGDVIISDRPAAFVIGLWFQIESEDTNRHTFEVEILGATDARLAQAAGEFALSDPQFNMTSFVRFPVIQFQSSERLNVRMRFDDGEWRSVLKKKIILQNKT